MALHDYTNAGRVNLISAKRLFFAILCSMQIVVMSTAVVSPSLHFLICHDDLRDVPITYDPCPEHHHGDSHENDNEPHDEHYCPVVIFSQGITMPEAGIPNYWEYLDFQFIEFTEPRSLSSSLSALLTRQRAPPLV
tara:strand:- start:42 stop:449 length:408 start_codon:yes stop_codon:yes gene_type:complete